MTLYYLWRVCYIAWVGTVASVPTSRLGLEKQRLTKVYQSRLQQGGQHVLNWYANSRWFGTHPKNTREWNQALVEYVEDSFSEGSPIWLVRHGLLAVQWEHRHLRRHIPRPCDALRGWQFQLASSHRAPMDIQVLPAIFAYAWMQALQSQELARYLIPMCILVRVAFWTLLRPGETWPLQRQDIMFTESVGAPIAVIRLRKPKTRFRFAKQQFAVLRDLPTVRWLAWLCNGLEDNTKLFMGSGQRFSEIFKMVMNAIGLSSIGFTPASLRTGGGDVYVFVRSLPRPPPPDGEVGVTINIRNVHTGGYRMSNLASTLDGPVSGS